ncbi:MAG: hypothetical protein JKX76_04190 [Colwellia sp.]|nr:hypothetical protein [Colwellia sp.]
MPQNKFKNPLSKDTFQLATVDSHRVFLVYAKNEFVLYKKHVASDKVEQVSDSNVVMSFDNENYMSVRYVIDGRIEGFLYEFHRKNKLSHVAFYSFGIMEGTELYIRKNGNVWIENNYLHGWFHGVVKHYFYGKGRLLRTAMYKNGKKEGEGIGYFRSGKVSMRTIYENGKADGVGQVYNRKGKIIRCNYYIQGELVKVEKND